MIGLIVAAVVTVSSQVTDVTVYNDRAQVIRSAEVELMQGANQIRFENLPKGVDARGIQVEGSGSATVQDVRFKVEDVEVISKAAWKELYVQKEKLEADMVATIQDIDVLKEAKSFLKKISTKVTSPTKTEGAAELNPESWEKMLTLYTDKNRAYDEQIRAGEAKLKKIREALRTVQEKIQASGANQKRKIRVVEVDLTTDKPRKVALRLSYIVPGPKWIPTYDVRVDTETRKMEMNYFALIRQSTGEDWKNVRLKLSTVNPGLGGKHPVLDPWRINVCQPTLGGGELGVDWSVSGLDSGDVDLRVASMSQQFAPVLNALTMNNSFQPVETRMAPAVRQGASVLFAVKGKSMIASDNVEHRVAISSISLPAHFRYSAVPKLDSNAYLKAKALNSGNYPFLEGKANVYRDGSYVATSTLELVPPGESFWVFLGADENMKVEHKLIKHYQSHQGLRNRTVRHMYEYLITVKNTHAVAEEFIIWDQLPISGNEDLKVKLIKPKYSKDTDSLRIDDERRIQWFQTLQPGQELKLPFHFYVEAPRNEEISGLE